MCSKASHAMASSTQLLPVQNQFDSIDLSDNGVVKLEGFPKLPRLKVLLLSNNRISKIARQLEGTQHRGARLLMANLTLPDAFCRVHSERRHVGHGQQQDLQPAGGSMCLCATFDPAGA